jgi:hypothetical protein
MAISVPSPYAVTDFVSLKQAADQFAECGAGRNPDARTLKRWAVKHGVRMQRSGRDVIASWTDLLEVHAVEVDRREAGQA